jgi:hypothetical protein
VNPRALVAIVLALGLAACGGGGAKNASVAPRASRTLDPYFDSGQRIEITDDAFVPAQLIAVVDQPVVWTNTSTHPVAVVFDTGTVHSKEIPPGGTFSYTSDAAVSITYHAAGRPKMKAAIQFEPPYMPGETPSPAPS